MRRVLLPIFAIPALCASASAAAAGLSDGNGASMFVPGVRVNLAFGGAPAASRPFDLHATEGSAPDAATPPPPEAPAPPSTSGLSSTTTWIVIGAVVVVVAVVAASNHSGGGNSGY